MLGPDPGRVADVGLEYRAAIEAGTGIGLLWHLLLASSRSRRVLPYRPVAVAIADLVGATGRLPCNRHERVIARQVAMGPPGLSDGRRDLGT